MDESAILECVLDNNETNTFFKLQSKTTQNKIIELGVYVWKNSNNKLKSLNNEEVNKWKLEYDVENAYKIKEYECKIEDIKQSNIDRENNLHITNRELLQKIEELKKSHIEEIQYTCKHQKKISEHSSEMTIKALNEEVKNLQQSVSSLYEKKGTELQTREDSLRQYYQTQLEKRDGKLIDFQKHEDKLREYYQTQLDKKEEQITSLQSQNINIIKTTQNSANKGDRGEFIYNEYLRSFIPDIEIIEKNKTKKNCDIEVRNGMIYSLHEVKFYKNSVDLNEINKLHNDIRINKPDYAILASLTSSISCKPNFTVEIIEECLVIYLSNVLESPENIRVACIIGDVFYKNKILNNNTKMETLEIEITKIRNMLKRKFNTMERNAQLTIDAIKDAKQLYITDLIPLLNDVFQKPQTKKVKQKKVKQKKAKQLIKVNTEIPNNNTILLEHNKS